MVRFGSGAVEVARTGVGNEPVGNASLVQMALASARRGFEFCGHDGRTSCCQAHNLALVMHAWLPGCGGLPLLISHHAGLLPRGGAAKQPPRHGAERWTRGNGMGSWPLGLRLLGRGA